MLDLQECVQHAAAKERKSLQEDLDALQEQMDTEIAAAERAAEATRAASAATYGSCTIEEVAEEPMEAFQVRCWTDVLTRRCTAGLMLHVHWMHWCSPSAKLELADEMTSTTHPA